MVRYNLIFQGRVQGVGFRYRSKLIADKLGLTGNIENLYNGDVECNIQGDKEKIEVFIQRLEDSRFIYIDNIIKKELDPIKEDEFYVK
ncbi:MAG: acylphosphatase [Anaerococcus sp.]|nr:acylphosphatase [Peptoniphilaceae bacterium]MDY3055763.1 acylphosphatase [Anaerococcus sp.]